MTIKNYFNINTVPFDVDLIKQHEKIKQGNLREHATVGALIAFLCFVLFVGGWLILTLLSIVISLATNINENASFTMMVFVRDVLIYGLPSFTVIGFIAGWRHATDTIENILTPISKNDCVVVLSLRDEEGHDKILDYINQVIAKREIEQWELNGLKEVAAKIKKSREEADEQKEKEAKEEAVRQACAQLYISGGAN